MDVNTAFVTPELLATAIDATEDGIYITDSSGIIVFANEAILRITGYNREQFLGQRTSVFKSGEMSRDYYRRLWNTVLSGRVWREVITNRRASGELYEASQTISPVTDSDGHISLMIAVQRDLTFSQDLRIELSRTHTEVERLLSEKETLLEEVYHRVKNDMELLASTLRLQIAESTEPNVSEALRTAADRAGTLGRMYQFLQSHNDNSRIPAGGLIRQLLDGLRRAKLPPNTAVVVHADAIEISPRVATSIAVLINELFTNSVKYGLGVNHEPKISVYLQKAEMGVLLRVSDNGPGFTEDVLNGGRSGLGLRMAHVLAGQYQGSVELSNNGGAVTTVHLKRL